MKDKKDMKKQVDVETANEILILLKKILKISVFLFIIVAIYAFTLIFKEWRIGEYFLKALTILSPVFIGLIIAWLFDPIVTWLKKKGLKRIFGTMIVYLGFFLVLGLIIGTIIPLLSEQINEFAKIIPGVFDSIKHWIDQVFDNLNSIDGFDAIGIKTEMFLKIEEYATNLTKDLPTVTVSVLTSIFSGLGNIVVGLIIGFFFLVSFKNVTETLTTYLPLKYRKDTKGLMEEVNGSLRRFVQGALFDSTIIFIITSLGLWAVGLKAPLLFGLFCGLTNIIPYAGPYIGGAPAVIVGFSQGPTTGLLVLAVIVVIQFIEGNFFQPLIMSKSTKLHPVTIISGLLIFGYFWGILGMFVSTPVIAALKSVFVYFDKKFHFFQFTE